MKILLLDIETQPDLVWTWGVYEQNAIEVSQHWQCLSFSARWFPHGKMITKGLCDYKGYKAGFSDQRLMKDVWDLLDEADIVVAHNGVNFDIKKLNARFIVHGMTPPSPFKVIDTKRAVKQVAAFSSNKLDWLSSQLDIGRKLAHEGFAMWQGCMNGDRKAWAKMKKYNAHDITLLGKLYEKLSPWIKQPNANMWAEGSICPNPACNSANIVRRGLFRSKTRLYIRFCCKDCGSWGKAVHSERKKAEITGI